MNKRSLVLISLVSILALSFSIYQYVKEFQADFVSGAYTSAKPANGHTWGEMECSQGLCIIGTGASQKIGMGTDNPTEKLQVVGNISATGTIQATGNITSSGDVCNGTGNCLSALATLTNACGGAAQSYAYNASAFSGTYCVMGTSTPASPSFPAVGSSTTWTCPVTSGSPVSCTATRAATPVPGVCGPAATSYVYSATAYSGALCSTGLASPTSPSFPTMGSSSSWSCLGTNGGASPSCTASRSNPLPLVNSGHTELDCANAGGTVVASGVGYNQCRFNGASCPTNWNTYLNWSTTTAAPFSSSYQYFWNPDMWYTCGSCTTGSHVWGNTAVESCSYLTAGWSNGNGNCKGPTVTGYANVTQVGCY